MSSSVRRIRPAHPKERFLVTVEVDPLAEDHHAQRRTDVTGVVKRLLETLDEHRIPATWAVSDPAFSAATSLVLCSNVEHEMAILGDANWLGPTAGRTRFARQLQRRLAQARSREIPVQSLVPRVASIGSHVDLVVKHGIRAVATVTNQTAARRGASVPMPLRYGVWEIPVSVRLPERSSWHVLTGWRIRRRIAAQRLFHLLVDATAVAQEGARCQAMFARIVAYVAELRNQGLLRPETLGMTAARLSHVPAPLPQRSILRRAA